MKASVLSILLPVILCLANPIALAVKTKRPQHSKPSQLLLGQELLPRFRFNTLLGAHVLRQSAVVVGAQFGYRITDGTRLYIGPEASFSLFGPGRLFCLMVSGWYEFLFPKTSTSLVSVGALVGPGFSEQISFLTPVNFVGFFDFSVAKTLDDLAGLRGQIRPGIVGKEFALMVNLNISFKFL